MSGNYPDGVNQQVFDEAHDQHGDPEALFVRELCPRCKCCQLEFVECDNCGGEGVTDHECGDDSCCCLEPVDNVACFVCDGDGSFDLCLGRCDMDGKHEEVKP